MADQWEGGSGKRETLLLVGVASIFTRGKLTGDQGLAILQASESLLRESRDKDKNGGMVGALASLYQDPELPVPLLERVLEVAMQLNSTFYRENVANQIQQAIKYVTQEQPDLTKAWRDMLAEVLAKKAEGRSAKPKMFKEIRGRLESVEDDEDVH